MTEPQVENEEYGLSIRQAAAIFGTSSRTLVRLLKSEGTPVLHLNGNMRVRKADVLALKAARIKPIE